MSSPADPLDDLPSPAPSRAEGGGLRGLTPTAVAGRWSAAIAGARGQLFPFVPVALGLGVGAYFALPLEPSKLVFALLAVAVLALTAGQRWAPEALRPLIMALALMGMGVMLAGWRSHNVAAPVLDRHRYGPVAGRIIEVDRSVSDAIRLTLDRVDLPGLHPDRVPLTVRVSIHGDLDVDPVVGTPVMLTGYLGPPSGPVEPGGFDFRRLAWFEQLGGIGYTRTPVLAMDDPAPGWGLSLTRLRQRIAEGIRARLPGDAGGFVAAILTGDRSGVSLQVTEDLRRSNLAHLLAISGLHMGLLTGVVYGALRGFLALIPLLALRWPIRKIAALGALAAASFYLALSGGNVATQRAFVMAAVMLGAVLVERRALSMRSVALAALILLVWRPEALLSVGFHMSFAATIALVAVFRALRDWRLAKGASRPKGWRRWLRPLAEAALCSLIAGVATAPFAAAQFHRVAEYGLIANLLAVPLMGALVMPAAVLAAALWPLGLEGVGLWLMAQGTRWILFVAAEVGGLEGAVRLVPGPPGWVMPMLSLGALWLVLWPGRARWAGVGLMVLALSGWTQATRPALLVEGEGGLVGLMGPEGRVLSKPRGAGFVARNWLEADGDAASQSEAAARAGMQAVEGGVRFVFAGAEWRHLPGRRGRAALPGHCAEGVTIVTDQWLDAPPEGGCRVLDRRALRDSGALAFSPDGTVTTAAAVSGLRPWTAP
ncbi:ComEC/Rec2 family competence protein [Pararhodobacter sp. CCB-MM2]|uniref:ComEC/Rec2 family competence protein n=1 Tax=Pararhodobacter sp. CCB-MM2 TaxID=1786003 RepID=UPI000AFFA429|nr:ComEC/Rec2 family competence protein [Pararhodobacter sp. CCB-MM2]